MFAADTPRVEPPLEFRSALGKLQRLIAGALHDAKFNSCHWAWHDIKRTKSAKKKKEIFNERFEEWRESSANAIRGWLPKFVGTTRPLTLFHLAHLVWGIHGRCSSFPRIFGARVKKVYLCTSDQPAETGGERPHKMKPPQTPFSNHLIGEGLGKPEIAGFTLDSFHRCDRSLLTSASSYR
jgi:hypothetical protein